MPGFIRVVIGDEEPPEQTRSASKESSGKTVRFASTEPMPAAAVAAKTEQNVEEKTKERKDLYSTLNLAINDHLLSEVRGWTAQKVPAGLNMVVESDEEESTTLVVSAERSMAEKQVGIVKAQRLSAMTLHSVHGVCCCSNAKACQMHPPCPSEELFQDDHVRLQNYYKDHRFVRDQMEYKMPNWLLDFGYKSHEDYPDNVYDLPSKMGQPFWKLSDGRPTSMIVFRSDLAAFIDKHRTNGSLRGVALSNALVHDEFMHKGPVKPQKGQPKDCKAMYSYLEAIIDQLNSEESRRIEAISMSPQISNVGSDVDYSN